MKVVVTMRFFSRFPITWLVLLAMTISGLKTANAQLRRHPTRVEARLPDYRKPYAPRPQARSVGLPGTNGALLLYAPQRGIGMRSNAFGSALQQTAEASDTTMTLFRSELLLRDTGFMSPVRRFAAGMVGPTSFDQPTQEEVERATEQFMNVEPTELDYSAVLARQIRSHQRRYLRDGFGYLKDGDLIRSAGAFDAAESANRDHPYPRFGKLIIDVIEKHYARATTRLATIMKYDAQRRPGMPSVFEHPLKWRDYFEADEDLQETMRDLREFAQKKLKNPSIQALYCYVLWYSGFEGTRIEARNVAASISRSHPKSNWAKLHSMIVEAEESAKRASENTKTSVSKAE